MIGPARWRHLTALAMALWLSFLTQSAPAQVLPDQGKGPVAIESDGGIEWRRDERLYVASGNAKASRGGVTVSADRLVARYREKAKPVASPAQSASQTGVDSLSSAGAGNIYRLEANGHVVVTTPTSQARSDLAVYDLDKKILVMTGDHLRLQTQQDDIRARDSLEYWEDRKAGVARGNAIAVRGDRTVAGDILTVQFADGAAPRSHHLASAVKQGGSGGAHHVSRVEAFGHVRVTSPTEVAIGDKGVYNADTGIATLIGDVKVTQGRDQLNGDYAEINLNTGVSRMLSGSAAGRAGGRVRGLIEPEPDKSKSSDSDGMRGG